MQKERKSSMAGSLFDDYMQTTVAVQYIESRRKIGAGQSTSTYNDTTAMHASTDSIAH